MLQPVRHHSAGPRRWRLPSGHSAWNPSLFPRFPLLTLPLRGGALTEPGELLLHWVFAFGGPGLTESSAGNTERAASGLGMCEQAGKPVRSFAGVKEPKSSVNARRKIILL